MILQELARYYERKANDPDAALAPEGFEQKEIPFSLSSRTMAVGADRGHAQSGEGKKRRGAILSRSARREEDCRRCGKFAVGYGGICAGH